MAPQKRTTKQAKQNPRQAKLDAFLEDFDAEVKSRVLHLKEQQMQLLTEIDNRYNMAIIKLPKAVRQMNWLLYFNPEKPQSPTVDDSKRGEVPELENILVENHMAAPKTLQKSSKKESNAKSSPEDENTAPKTKKVRRELPSTCPLLTFLVGVGISWHLTIRFRLPCLSTSSMFVFINDKKPDAGGWRLISGPPLLQGKSKRPPVTSKKTRVQSVLGQTGRKSTRKNLVTPARSMLDSSMMMGATPLITPRFDPRLPKTPGVRVPRHKERIYSISVNGSPVQSSNQDIVINVPIGNGENIQLLASQMDSVDLSSLDEAALEGIRRLQSRLATLL
ncbi:borealin-like [Gadus macrocephalus]|uniref:borealin-like n=1 Tax=Gadus macrocephalus TaxID=80720 RepID=UPI0028CB164D|nr:borealin-like [Gadus macrocephalus]